MSRLETDIYAKRVSSRWHVILKNSGIELGVEASKVAEHKRVQHLQIKPRIRHFHFAQRPVSQGIAQSNMVQAQERGVLDKMVAEILRYGDVKRSSAAVYVVQVACRIVELVVVGVARQQVVINIVAHIGAASEREIDVATGVVRVKSEERIGGRVFVAIAVGR